MTDGGPELRRIVWSECFSFTHVFRAFRMAIHPTKLALAFCAILIVYCSGRVLDVLWPTSSQPWAYVAPSGKLMQHQSIFENLKIFIDGGPSDL